MPMQVELTSSSREGGISVVSSGGSPAMRQNASSPSNIVSFKSEPYAAQCSLAGGKASVAPMRSFTSITKMISPNMEGLTIEAAFELDKTRWWSWLLPRYHNATMEEEFCIYFQLNRATPQRSVIGTFVVLLATVIVVGPVDVVVRLLMVAALSIFIVMLVLLLYLDRDIRSQREAWFSVSRARHLEDQNSSHIPSNVFRSEYNSSTSWFPSPVAIMHRLCESHRIPMRRNAERNEQCMWMYAIAFAFAYAAVARGRVTCFGIQNGEERDMVCTNAVLFDATLGHYFLVAVTGVPQRIERFFPSTCAISVYCIAVHWLAGGAIPNKVLAVALIWLLSIGFFVAVVAMYQLEQWKRKYFQNELTLVGQFEELLFLKLRVRMMARAALPFDPEAVLRLASQEQSSLFHPLHRSTSTLVALIRDTSRSAMGPVEVATHMQRMLNRLRNVDLPVVDRQRCGTVNPSSSTVPSGASNPASPTSGSFARNAAFWFWSTWGDEVAIAVFPSIVRSVQGETVGRDVVYFALELAAFVKECCNDSTLEATVVSESGSLVVCGERHSLRPVLCGAVFDQMRLLQASNDTIRALCTYSPSQQGRAITLCGYSFFRLLESSCLPSEMLELKSLLSNDIIELMECSTTLFLAASRSGSSLSALDLASQGSQESGVKNAVLFTLLVVKSGASLWGGDELLVSLIHAGDSAMMLSSSAMRSRSQVQAGKPPLSASGRSSFSRVSVRSSAVFGTGANPLAPPWERESQEDSSPNLPLDSTISDTINSSVTRRVNNADASYVRSLDLDAAPPTCTSKWKMWLDDQIREVQILHSEADLRDYEKERNAPSNVGRVLLSCAFAFLVSLVIVVLLLMDRAREQFPVGSQREFQLTAALLLNVANVFLSGSLLCWFVVSVGPSSSSRSTLRGRKSLSAMLSRSISSLDVIVLQVGFGIYSVVFCVASGVVPVHTVIGNSRFICAVILLSVLITSPLGLSVIGGMIVDAVISAFYIANETVTHDAAISDKMLRIKLIQIGLFWLLFEILRLMFESMLRRYFLLRKECHMLKHQMHKELRELEKIVKSIAPDERVSTALVGSLQATILEQERNNSASQTSVTGGSTPKTPKKRGDGSMQLRVSNTKIKSTTSDLLLRTEIRDCSFLWFSFQLHPSANTWMHDQFVRLIQNISHDVCRLASAALRSTNALYVSVSSLGGTSGVFVCRDAQRLVDVGRDFLRQIRQKLKQQLLQQGYSHSELFEWKFTLGYGPFVGALVGGCGDAVDRITSTSSVETNSFSHDANSGVEASGGEARSRKQKRPPQQALTFGVFGAAILELKLLADLCEWNTAVATERFMSHWQTEKRQVRPESTISFKKRGASRIVASFITSSVQ